MSKQRSKRVKVGSLENKLGGMARQAELQSKLPIPSAPVLNEFPDKRSDLDPNVHLDEKIDISKNLPDGHAINKGGSVRPGPVSYKK